MPDKITGFFEFFMAAPLKMGCYGAACFLIGAVAGILLF